VPSNIYVDQIIAYSIALYQVVVPWSVVDYCAHLPARPKGFDCPREDEILAKFPPLYQRPFPTVTEPCCVVDNQGVILAWYLPRCLTAKRQVCELKLGHLPCKIYHYMQDHIWNASQHIQPFFVGGRIKEIGEH
jgi:hypothetical protein